MSDTIANLIVNPGQPYAVLTGDVVGSSMLDEAARRALPAALKNASRATRSLFGKAVPLDVDIFRGDSWQLLVTDAKLGLRVAVFFRSHIHGNSPDAKLDTRIGIGIGTIDFIPENQVSQGDGPAFRKSGMLLESIPKRRRMVLSVADAETPTGIDPVIGLMDAVMKRWTGKQALAVVGMLEGLPQYRIAQHWMPPVSPPVIARHLLQAEWEAVQNGITYVENSL